MALGDYILCHKCEVKLIYDGDRAQRDWWEDRWGKAPEILCPDCNDAQQSKDAKRLDWLAIHGSFGVDSVTDKPGGNGQKRIAATRQAIDAAMQGGQK